VIYFTFVFQPGVVALRTFKNSSQHPHWQIKSHNLTGFLGHNEDLWSHLSPHFTVLHKGWPESLLWNLQHNIPGYCIPYWFKVKIFQECHLCQETNSLIPLYFDMYSTSSIPTFFNLFIITVNTLHCVNKSTYPLTEYSTHSQNIHCQYLNHSHLNFEAKYCFDNTNSHFLPLAVATVAYTSTTTRTYPVHVRVFDKLYLFFFVAEQYLAKTM